MLAVRGGNKSMAIDGRRRTLTRRAFLLAATAVAALLAVSARAESQPGGVPASGHQEFAIFREGEQIGRHVSEFTDSGGRLTVRTHVNIAVKVLLVTAFRFDMETEEQWVDGQLVALRTRADDDGRKRVLDATRDDGAQPQVLRVDYNGHPSTLPAGMLPTSWWNPATVDQTRLLDNLNGKTRAVTVAPRGSETVQIAGRAVPAKHYEMRGEVERELWYGLDGQLLMLRFPAEDGSLVTVIRKSL
jgi:hypothetical protein